MGYQDQGQQPEKDDGPGLLQRLLQPAKQLWQMIKENKGIILKISIIVVIVVALISAGIAFQGEISKWLSAPVVTSFEAGALSIIEGESTTLQWEVTGATSVSIDPDIGTVPPSGTREVSPGSTTIYTLSAGNLMGSISKPVTITVTAAPPAITSFSPSADSIIAGQAATLAWNVAGAKSVSIEPGIGPVASNGTKSVSPGSTTTYTLTASNGAGNSTASVKIAVNISNAPVITAFTISPSSIKSGESITLTWDVVGATSININQGIGGVASKGSIKATPTATITYTLTADNSYSSMTRAATVTVDTTGITPTTQAVSTSGPPVISAFYISPATIMLGENITLNWAVTGARTISISPNVGVVPSSGYTLVVPAETATYTLSAVNSFGTETATATVTVNKTTDGIPPVISSFTATPSSISSGAASTLTWNINGATLITIDPGIGTPASFYSQPIYPTETTTYTLTAFNSNGTDNRTVTVTVTP